MATTVSLKPNAVEISGSTSGTTTLQATAVAGTTTLTLPAATDTLVGKATTDTLTNKTLTSPTITGGALNGTVGATTPSTGAFTTMSATTGAAVGGATAGAGGLAFPATAVAVANANTLDDYEEGTWTPTLTGSTSSTGITYSGQVGRYIKIGNLVTVDISLTLSAKTLIVGDVIITGIPFTANTSPNTALTWGYWANFGANWSSVGGWLNAGNIIYLGGRKTAGAGIETMSNTDIATNSVMNFSITYVAA